MPFESFTRSQITLIIGKREYYCVTSITQEKLETLLFKEARAAYATKIVSLMGLIIVKNYNPIRHLCPPFSPLPGHCSAKHWSIKFSWERSIVICQIEKLTLRGTQTCCSMWDLSYLTRDQPPPPSKKWNKKFESYSWISHWKSALPSRGQWVSLNLGLCFLC